MKPTQERKQIPTRASGLPKNKLPMPKPKPDLASGSMSARSFQADVVYPVPKPKPKTATAGNGDSVKSKLYVGAGTGYRPNAQGGFIGYDVNKHVAVEGFFDDMGQQPRNPKTGKLVSDNVNRFAGARGIVKMPIPKEYTGKAGEFTPYVSAGVVSAYWGHKGVQYDPEHFKMKFRNSFSATVGGGVEWKPPKEMGLGDVKFRTRYAYYPNYAEQNHHRRPNRGYQEVRVEAVMPVDTGKAFDQVASGFKRIFSPDM